MIRFAVLSLTISLVAVSCKREPAPKAKLAFDDGNACVEFSIAGNEKITRRANKVFRGLYSFFDEARELADCSKAVARAKCEVDISEEFKQDNNYQKEVLTITRTTFFSKAAEAKIVCTQRKGRLTLLP